MRATRTTTGLTALAFLALAGAALGAAPTPREILGGELIVKDALNRRNRPGDRVRYLPDSPLTQAFPDDLFYRVLPPAAPADTPAVPKPARLAAVGPDGRVTLLDDPKAVIALFRAAFHPAAAAERPRAAARAALLLVQAEYPDYTFSVPAEDVRVTDDPAGGWRVTASAPARGDLGTVRVSLRLDPRGEVRDVTDTIDLKPTTPAAVALDVAAAEKLVKKQLVEAGLPVEGVKVIDDPGLKQSAPGHVFFVVPQAGHDKDDPQGTVNVTVVGPHGKPVELFGPRGQLRPWLLATLGRVTGDPGYRTAMRLVTGLVEARHPDFTFGRPEASQVTSEGNGQTLIVRKTPYTTPNGRKGIMEVHLRFGKGGKLVSWGVWYHRAD